VTGSVLAVTINAQGGSYLSFAFPLGLFCVVAAVLYLVLFGRPHQRVPARRAGRGQAVMPDAGTARAAAAHGATAADVSDGSSSEQRAEPGAESAAEAAPGNVAAQDGGPASADDPQAGTTNGTEASE
jgi:hypothetical protein